MLQKLAVLALVIVVAISITSYSAFGDTPIMSKAQRDQLFNKVPNFQANNINYFFQIIITPTGVQQNNVILDQKNYTAIKNNVGFFTACGGFNNGLCEPPVITTASPNSNYCPIALMILENQDTYITKLYNTTSGLDLTDYVYPPYCYSETGPNVVNGKGVPSVPEFNMTGLVSIIAILSLITFSKLGRKLQ